jgi:ATP-binding cassette subfamily B protein
MRGASELRLVTRLMAHAVRQRPSIIAITALGIVSSIAEITAMISVVPLGILASGGTLAKSSIWHHLPSALGILPDTKFFVLLFLSIMLFRMATYIASMVLSTHIMQSLFAYFASRAHAAFVRHLSFEEIIKHQIGHFFVIAGDESNRGAQIVAGVMRLIPIILLFAIYTVFIFYQSWKSGLTLFLLLLGMALSLKGVFRRTLALGRRQQEESRATNTHFFDSLGGLRTIRGFNAETFVTKRYESLMDQYTWTTFLTDSFGQLAQSPFMLIIAAALTIIAISVNNATMVANMPLFFAGVMIFTRLMPIASSGLDIAMRLTANLRAGRNIEEMLQAVEDCEQAETLSFFPANERIDQIEFDRITFRYSEDTPPVLKDFSYIMQAGTSYAITGASGVGKSSLIDLLLKFYSPAQGAIRVNGRDIATFSTTSLRQHMILSEQATRIFYGTVLENVQFDADAKEAAKEALQLVGLTEVLQSLPNGMDTVLAFQGNNFSGGQRQRIGIARALVRTADVLILDESTNALDSETRKLILETLISAYKERILIFITHDPVVIERVDKVIELLPQKDGDAIAAE